MTENDLRKVFLDELTRIAPELDPATLRGGDHLQDDLDLDSMDVLNLVIALNARLGIAIPEADYPRIATADLAAVYLAERLAAPGH